MRYVFDTNALSAVMQGQTSVLARLRHVARNEACVPQPVLAEISYGIARLPASKRKDWLRGRFEFVKREFPRVEWTDDVSDAFGEIKARLEKKGQRLEDFDIAIAAHALALDGTLVTANVAHMLRVPHLRIEDWAK
ncbi:MAG: PIN domain-containing protein [Polyangiaceae bacterium]